jgi:hypothetical protein
MSSTLVPNDPTTRGIQTHTLYIHLIQTQTNSKRPYRVPGDIRQSCLPNLVLPAASGLDRRSRRNACVWAETHVLEQVSAAWWAVGRLQFLADWILTDTLARIGLCIPRNISPFRGKESRIGVTGGRTRGDRYTLVSGHSHGSWQGESQCEEYLPFIRTLSMSFVMHQTV